MNIRREVISVAVIKLDPPPITDDVSELRNYVSDLYESLTAVFYSIDSENMTEEFLEKVHFTDRTTEG